jgi:dUTP pyrophosphatase
MIKIKFKKFHKNAQFPKKITEFAGGWDVVVTELIKEFDDFIICKLGFGLQPPPNYKVTLVPRSSLTKTKWLLQNYPGLGDPDYLGEYQLRFRAIPFDIKKEGGDYGSSVYWKLEYPNFPYKEGDRIGQIYLEEIIPIEFEEVEELSTTERGEGGYGSTGK